MRVKKAENRFRTLNQKMLRLRQLFRHSSEREDKHFLNVISGNSLNFVRQHTLRVNFMCVRYYNQFN